MKHINRIKRLQCLMVGAPYRKIDFKADCWFMGYEWTKKRSLQFVRLVELYLILSKGARIEIMDMSHPSRWEWVRDRCRAAAEEWVWQYGWRDTEK